MSRATFRDMYGDMYGDEKKKIVLLIGRIKNKSIILKVEEDYLVDSKQDAKAFGKAVVEFYNRTIQGGESKRKFIKVISENLLSTPENQAVAVSDNYVTDGNIVVCNVTDYIGSINAEHYYGKLYVFNINEKYGHSIPLNKVSEYGLPIAGGVELQHKVTKREWNALCKKDGYDLYFDDEEGMLTYRFKEIKDVVNAGVSEYIKQGLNKTHDFVALYHGDDLQQPVVILRDTEVLK